MIEVFVKIEVSGMIEVTMEVTEIIEEIWEEIPNMEPQGKIGKEADMAPPDLHLEQDRITQTIIDMETGDIDVLQILWISQYLT